MDRRKFLDRLSSHKTPPWPCPSCRESVLEILPGSFISGESSVSRDERENDAWEPTWTKNRYCCLLKCTNGSCGEKVANIGIGGFREAAGYDAKGEPVLEYPEWYEPRFFVPNLVLMDIPQTTPEMVTKELNSSFSLFFHDPNSAGNSIRAAIKALLTALKVKRFTVTKGKRSRIALHHRIEKLPSKYQNIEESLKAIKWIGNHGSHSGQMLTSDAVLDAYDLMEVVLDDLFSNKRKRLAGVAKKINSRKKPRA